MQEQGPPVEPSPLARGSAWRSTSHATLRLARITKLVYRTNIDPTLKLTGLSQPRGRQRRLP